MAAEYLRRTPTSTGNRRVWTWSGWVKRNTPNANRQGIFATTNDAGTVFTGLEFDGNEKFQWYEYNLTTGTTLITTSQTFRDIGNWMHILAVLNSSASSSQDRAKIYVNGALITLFTTDGRANIPINMQSEVNGILYPSYIGSWGVAAPTLYSRSELTDVFFIDSQALTPDVFGFYKEGKGYISAGSTQATDFRPGQWVPKTPRVIKTEIIRRGGFGVNGFYLPMNDSNNFGADFHGDPNSIITLNEKLPQPRVGVATTASVGLGYTDALRADPFAANLVLALPFVSGGLSSGFGDYAPSIKGSGSAKTVTVNGSVSVANTHGYYGNAAFFNGSSGNYLSLADNTDFEFGSGDYTVEFWCNPSRSVNFEEIVSKGFPWQLYRSSNSQFSLAVSSDNSNYWINSNIGVGAINQWHHIAVSKKGSTTYGFLNGVCGLAVTNSSSVFDGTSSLVIGSYEPAPNLYLFQGYIQDFRVYKGVAKYTGGFDVPRPYTPVGIATWRAVPDTTANNFATWNAVQNSMSLTDGNLTCTGTGSNQEVYSTVGITTGKWYVEARTNVGTYNHFGVRANSTTAYDATYRLIARDDGNVYGDTSQGQIGTLSSGYASAGSIVAMAIDGNLGQITYYVNGINVGGPYSIYQYNSSSLPTSYKIYNLVNSGDSLTVNFGQNPTFSGNTTAGTFTDSNGKGLFKYQPPSGFLALCEDNLPTPAISNPGQYFKTVLYRGSGASRNLVGIGFTPDLVWIKGRDVQTNNHVLFDSVRGATSGGYLMSAQTSAETPNSTMVLSFDNDGFSLGSDSTSAVNNSSINYVAWCWRAGAGTTSTNTNGTINSVVSVNQDAGFSIVSYTGNGNASATVGHGLGRTPAMVIVKCRNEVRSWIVFHRGASPTPNPLSSTTFALGSLSSGCLSLNLTNGTFTYTMDGQTNLNGNTYIAYCWAEIEGFSKFGSYVGNGSADGPFVFCNFSPAFVLIKRATGGTGNWAIFDNSRDSTNPVFGYLVAESSAVEERGTAVIDFTSNGFKIRNSWTTINSSGDTIIFAAFAQSPFTTANAK